MGGFLLPSKLPDWAGGDERERFRTIFAARKYGKKPDREPFMG
jgi:hypothetical protein